MFFSLLYLQLMENIVTSLKIRCVRSGTNLTKVCAEAGVNRQLLTKWERQEPKTIKLLRKLEAVLDKYERLEELANTPQL